MICPAETPSINVTETAAYGARVYVADGQIDECGALVGKGAANPAANRPIKARRLNRRAPGSIPATMWTSFSLENVCAAVLWSLTIRVTGRIS